MLQVAQQPLTVYLDPDTASRIEALVRSGRYANASQIVQEALAQWRSNCDQHEFELKLKKTYETGMTIRGRDHVTAASFMRSMGDMA
ncbi:ribbon-helix-helix domain-containing protein [Rhizobium sp. CAU 1783]